MIAYRNGIVIPFFFQQGDLIGRFDSVIDKHAEGKQQNEHKDRSNSPCPDFDCFFIFMFFLCGI